MIAVKEDQGTKDFVVWQNSVGFLAASKMFLTASLKFGDSWENFGGCIKIIHGCALRKIVGSPMLSACEIQGAQQMISVKNLKFSSFDQLRKLGTRATVHGRAQLLDTRNAFLLTDFLATQTKFCIVLTRPKPVPVGSYVPQFHSWRHTWHVITWLLISLSWSIGISSRWIRGLTHSARCFFRQVLAVNDLHKEQGKIESLWR